LQKKLHLPNTPFNGLFLAWVLFLLANIAFSDSIANSILSFFSFLNFSPFVSNFGFRASNFLSPALPLSPSWQIALSSIGSSLKNAAIGVGLGNFGNAFTLFRPQSFNLNEFWFLRFNNSISPALTVLIEQGFLGLSFWLFFFYKSYQSYRSYQSHDQNFYYPSRTRNLIKFLFFLIAVCFVFFLFDFSSLIFGILPARHALQGIAGGESWNFGILNLISLISLISLFSVTFLLAKKPFPKKLFPITLISLISLISLAYILSPRINPQLKMQSALEKIQQAEKIAAQNKPDKTQIKKLISESLSLSSYSLSLDPKNSNLHLNHLDLLNHLSNLIENSYKLIPQEFQTTISLDPKNPQIFLELGRYQYKNQNFIDAEKSIKYAINLKNDYSPAWFDLYQTYQSLEDQSTVINNETLKKQYSEVKIKALKETERLVCEVNYSKTDCDKITNLSH
jgi:hypothetical protein